MSRGARSSAGSPGSPWLIARSTRVPLCAPCRATCCTAVARTGPNCHWRILTTSTSRAIRATTSAWGTGGHLCAGIHVARLEMAFMLEVLLDGGARLRSTSRRWERTAVSMGSGVFRRASTEVTGVRSVRRGTSQAATPGRGRDRPVIRRFGEADETAAAAAS